MRRHLTGQYCAVILPPYYLRAFFLSRFWLSSSNCNCFPCISLRNQMAFRRFFAAADHPRLLHISFPLSRPLGLSLISHSLLLRQSTEVSIAWWELNIGAVVQCCRLSCHLPHKNLNKQTSSKCCQQMPNADVLTRPALPWQQSLSARGTNLHPESDEDTKDWKDFCRVAT